MPHITESHRIVEIRGNWNSSISYALMARKDSGRGHVFSLWEMRLERAVWIHFQRMSHRWWSHRSELQGPILWTHWPPASNLLQIPGAEDRVPTEAFTPTNLGHTAGWRRMGNGYGGMARGRDERYLFNTAGSRKERKGIHVDHMPIMS